MPNKRKKIEESKLFAFLAVLFTIVGFIIALVAKKDDKYVMFYAKQGLVLFFASIIIWVANFVPILGHLLYGFLWLVWVILWIIGIVYSLSGEMKDIPIIGEFANGIRL